MTVLAQGSAHKHHWLMVLLMLLLAELCHSAMMLKTSNRSKGKNLNLYVMPLIINGLQSETLVEVATSSDQQDHYVKLDDFVQALGLQMVEEDQQYTIDTPIGTAWIAKDNSRIVNDYWVVDINHLSEVLAMDIEVDPSSFAIRISSLWLTSLQTRPQVDIRPGDDPITPDINSSDNSLSYLRSEYFFRHQNSQTTKYSETEAGGRLLSGAWHLTARDYLDGDLYLEDYTWIKTRDNSRLMIGNHVVSLNPLIESTDFTGVQFAWANQGIQPFLRNIRSRQLINDANGSVRSFSGQGVPGGLVELRIEGVKLATTLTRLDGRYEFNDVEIPAGTYVQTEAWIYKPNESGVPHRIEDLSRFNSNRNLANNTWLVQGGLGLDGNLVEQDNLEQAGYLRSQYTFNQHLTINSIIQSIDGSDVSLLGVSGYWGHIGYWELDTAFMGSQQAWRVETHNMHGNWVFRGGAQHRPDGWIDEGIVARDDQYAELMYNGNRKLQVSLISRRIENENDDISYTLPAATWRPHTRVTLQARPDYNGDYVYRGHWKINHNQQLNLFSDPNENALLWNYRINSQQQVNVQHQHRDDDVVRSSVIYHHFSRGIQSLGWSVGLIAGKYDVGYLAQADYEFIPGLKVRGQVIKDPIGSSAGEMADTVYGLNVVGSFNVNRGQLTRGQQYRVLNNTGTISGRIISDTENIDHDFSGLWILLNGQRQTKTEKGGQFSVQNLDPGIYQVTLDLAGLPLELAPVKEQFWVEVAANANSALAFELQLMLGISGQLFADSGLAIIDEVYQITDSDGQPVKHGKTNRFGQFRSDGLPPGRYTITTSQGACAKLSLTNQYITMNKIRMMPPQRCQEP